MILCLSLCFFNTSLQSFGPSFVELSFLTILAAFTWRTTFRVTMLGTTLATPFVTTVIITGFHFFLDRCASFAITFIQWSAAWIRVTMVFPCVIVALAPWLFSSCFFILWLWTASIMSFPSISLQITLENILFYLPWITNCIRLLLNNFLDCV